MRIAEIFYSIQGEGALVGVPSVFVRTSGCNLRCSWCDTPYTSWHPEGEERTVDEIVAEVARHPATHTVVTGGEPMIAREIAALTQSLRPRHITIETAGTIFEAVACDLMSISPKLSNSTPEGSWAGRHEERRMQPEVLQKLIRHYDYQLKFVIAKPGDMTEVEDLLAALDADRTKVILMPEGVDGSVLRERSLWLVEICKERGYRFSPRLHVDLWGNRRGI